MRGFQNNKRNWILAMAFWATCKIAQPIQPIWQHIFALPWSALKRPPWEFNFLHIFGIPSSSRHEKCCQILQTVFWVFQYSRNSQWNTSITVHVFRIHWIKNTFASAYWLFLFSRLIVRKWSKVDTKSKGLHKRLDWKAGLKAWIKRLNQKAEPFLYITGQLYHN